MSSNSFIRIVISLYQAAIFVCLWKDTFVIIRLLSYKTIITRDFTFVVLNMTISYVLKFYTSINAGYYTSALFLSTANRVFVFVLHCFVSLWLLFCINGFKTSYHYCSYCCRLNWLKLPIYFCCFALIVSSWK